MRILFVSSNRIGDAVLSSGVLAALYDRYPDARFTIAAGAASAPLFEDFPGLEKLIVFQKQRSRGLHWFHLWKQTAFTWWPIVVDMRRSAIGWIVPRHRLYRVPKADGPIHRVALAGAVIGRALDPPAPKLWVSDDREAKARKVIGGDAPVIAIGPTANWQGKIWPADRFVQLVGRLLDNQGPLPGARIAVIAAPSERELADPVLQSIPADRRIALMDMALPDIVAALKQCRAYIGNDSGLMHIAAAVGTPTLGLYGPSKTELYGPWGPHTDFVRTRESYEELIGRPGYDRHTTGSLMTSITVDQVYDALVGLLKRVER
ncbi:glycosyltransferase family 9 protein [Hwanghaeella grinnelliae]|uniref:Glycosyltransferase family 9 protein n=1 Tax=Hwanghaeella grinnelliae TaxID=2500179 RepID=A0A437QJR6_9PROT|nr:glycosyltransferase family 9 protein [Hwanghaeella grinnelliae]RVU34749.1 glycosyltransferase family 9 protein [Hwanghaeella grinnelliae]